MRLLRPFRPIPPDILTSTLYNERSFYPAFMRDLAKCEREVLIESPFITHKRINALYPTFRKLTKRGVRVVVNTRDPDEHDARMAEEAYDAVATLQELSVEVLYTDKLHRKLVVIDREILFEGSLNPLSQSYSCEFMRRISSQAVAKETLRFIHLTKFL